MFFFEREKEDEEENNNNDNNNAFSLSRGLLSLSLEVSPIMWSDD
jgi:hypothetical protein